VRAHSSSIASGASLPGTAARWPLPGVALPLPSPFAERLLATIVTVFVLLDLARDTSNHPNLRPIVFPSCGGATRLHYQEDVRDSRRVLSCCIHRAAEHMFFERCEVVSAHDRGSGFPPYVTALITAQIDRKLIYIPKTCADMLRKQKWPAFFTHEVAGQVYKWKPVFAGLRSWCWKRLLVKTIFLQAFGKIATRTKTLLSLYKNVEGETNDSVKALLREADNATADTLGDLSYKEMWLPSEQKETRKKALQLKHVVLVSLHKYRERRHAAPGGVERRTHACTTCPVSRKQLKWLKYFEDDKTAQNAASCRFLRLSKRLSASDFVQNCAKAPTADEDFFVYRDYLYFKKAASYHVVNVQNAYYIKFPPTFAIRARGKDLADLHVCEVREDTLHDMFFFTAFDTRRYSWFRNYRLDTEEDTRDIEDFEKISLSPGAAGWQTVSDHFDDNLQWAWGAGMSIEKKLSVLKPAYDLEDLSSVTSSMFTLPDLCLKTLTRKNVTNLYAKPSLSPEVFHEVPEADILSPETWMPIKGNSTPLRVKKAEKQTVSLRAVYENARLKEIMSRIDQTLKPSSSEKASD
jgi:hypothetical protein